MKAALVVADPSSCPVEVGDVPTPAPDPHWVVVRLRRAALNRLDAMLLESRDGQVAGAILGADGAGVIASVGSALAGDPRFSVGDAVVISPSLFWGPDEAGPGEDYEILGSPTNGTHAEYVAVPAANVFPVPPHLTWSQAAALPLAGLTAWRALSTRGGLRSATKVVVGAASSGVGSMAIQMAVATGAEVVAVTSGEEKARRALELGAHTVVDRSADDVDRQLMCAARDADLALDPTGALWQPFVDVLRPGGRLVVVGKMAAPTACLRVQSVYWKQVDIVGSSMGSLRDFEAMLEHVTLRGWAPVVDSEFALDDIAAAYARLDDPARVGKVVIVTEGRSR
jgi:NADPH:quinone reductase-like Zn-dependent oxidoreductase